jgi:cobalt/nickel transport system permease protein
VYKRQEESIAFYLKRSLLALPFVLAALPVIFTLPGQALVGFSIGSWQFQVSLPGVERFISILIKSWVSVQMAVVLTTTTPFPDLLMAMRALRLPRLLVGVIGLMWRYMFVLVDEAMRLNRARASRSGEAGNASVKSGGNFAWRARVTGGMVGNLFMRSFDRSDRIYVSMLSRGYDGEVRNLPQPAAPRWTWTVLAAGLLVLGMITVIALLGWT